MSFTALQNGLIPNSAIFGTDSVANVKAGPPAWVLDRDSGDLTIILPDGIEPEEITLFGLVNVMTVAYRIDEEPEVIRVGVCSPCIIMWIEYHCAFV